MSYSRHELNTLSYVVSFFDSSEYKFIAPLIRKEYGNVRSVNAYVSRMYVLRSNPALMVNQTEEYKELHLSYSLLKAALKPEVEVEIVQDKSIQTEEEEEEKEDEEKYNINLVKAEFHHYKMDVKNNFLRMKKIIQEQQDKIDELNVELTKKIHLEVSNNIGDVDVEMVDRSEQEEEEEKKPEEEKKNKRTLSEMRESDSLIPKRTTSEWRKHQLKEHPKNSVTVFSDTDEEIEYSVRYDKKQNGYYCDCLAWRYQHIASNFRTCKHIRSVRGEVAESQRINSNIQNPNYQRYKKPEQPFNTKPKNWKPKPKRKIVRGKRRLPTNFRFSKKF